MLRTKASLILPLLLVLMLAGTWVAQAEIVIYSGDGDVPQVGKLPAATAGEIKVNDALVFKIPGAGGGVPLDVRAEIADTRLTEILCAWTMGTPVTVGEVRGKPTIWVGEYRLITVYPEDAAAEGTDMKSLANSWAANVSAMLWKCSPMVGPNAAERVSHPVTPAPAPAPAPAE